MPKKLLLAALLVLALAALTFALLHDWDEPPNDPRMMGGPHLGTPRPSSELVSEPEAEPTRSGAYEEGCP